jgi:hypothetical protein
MKFAAVFFATCFAALGSAIPTEKRQSLAQVITKCTKPNHVALTFVRFERSSDYSELIFIVDQDDGPWFYLSVNLTSLLGRVFHPSLSLDTISARPS